MSISLDVVVLGLIQGLLYGLLAVGLVLVYRAARFVNFAQANLGLISSVLLGKMVLDLGVPYLLAVPLALGASVLLGGVIELAVIRRLFNSPRLVLMVASIFLAQLLLVPRLIKSLNPAQSKIVLRGFPLPFHLQLQVGSLVVGAPDVLILVVVPVVVAALAAFLRLSSYGQAIRAAAENPDAARLAGISVRRMSTLVWVIAGLLSGVAAILAAPTQSVFVLGGSGASILVRALGAALIGRMTSLPIAFGAGIGIGVLESVTFANFPSGGVVELVVFAVVMGALLWRAAELSRASRDPSASVNFGAEAVPLARRVAALAGVRRMRGAAVLGSAVIGAVLPLLPVFGLNTAAKTFLLSLVLVYAIVGVSLCVLTGWGGQVSLGQFALVGVGAFAAARLAGTEHLPFWLVTVLAGALGSVVAVGIGLPAVRIQGLFLAVSTLAFAVLAQGYLFQQASLVGNPGGVYTPRPADLQSERSIYYFGLLALIVFVAVARNFRRSGPGRLLIAVRDNDRAARTAGVSAVGSRLVGFAIAGFMASVAGVLYAYAKQRYVATDFSPDDSFNMLTMVVIGGLGSLPGAVLGAAFEFGLPVLAKGTQASQLFQFLFGGVGGLVFLMFIPRGLSGGVYAVRNVVAERLERKADGLPPAPSLVPPWRELWRVGVGRRSESRVATEEAA